MPTPVGHSLAGLAVQLAWRDRPVRRAGVLAVCLVALANLPDIDLLPGYLIGDPRAFHWGASHSFAVAVMAGVLFGAVARRFTGRFLPYFILGSVAYGSHIVLDLLLGPGSLPNGIQVFWPVSPERYMAPWSVFKVMPGAIHEVGPVRVLFTRDALPLIVRELTVLLPVCLAALLLGRRPRTQRRERADGSGIALRGRGRADPEDPLPEQNAG